MLLPEHIKPEDSVYYNGGIVLKVLLKKGCHDLFTTFSSVNEERKMSFSLFLLCIDWLFLLGAISMNHQKIELCLSKD